MVEEYSGKSKCSIYSNVLGGRCKHPSTKYIFGITLCDNHHHMLYGMSGNIISKDDNGYDKLAGIIAEKMEKSDD
tara:strand:- start:212 stop:436 length:225 start_codon:yes stop_codon:yes gene_type:complete